MPLEKDKIYSLKELLENFFQISRDTFNRKRQFYLDELNGYCDYEEKKGKDGRLLSVTITEVYDPGPYVSVSAAKRKEIEDFIDTDWGRYDEPNHTMDSLRIVVNRYCATKGITYDLPLYIYKEVVWTKENSNKTKTDIERVKNPALREWWYIYGVMSRHQHKKKQNIRYTYALIKDNNFLACYRMTEEEEAKAEKISKEVFGQKGFDSFEIRRFVEYCNDHVKRGEALTGEDIISFSPVFKRISNDEKWKEFLNRCSDEGLESFVRSTDRTMREALEREIERLKAGEAFDF